MIQIERGKVSDINGIMVINNHYNRGNPKEFMLSSLAEAKVIIAKRNSKMVGYLLYQNMWGNTPFLSLIQINKIYQKQGIGRKMIEELEKVLKEKGHKSYLSSCTKGKEIAYNFHIKMGFEEIGLLNMEHGEEVFFNKTL